MKQSKEFLAHKGRPPSASTRSSRSLKKLEKQALAISKGIARGRNQAEYKKPLLVSLREHTGKIIDRIDPLKAVAFGATTSLVFIVLKNSKVVAEAMNVIDIGLAVAGGVTSVLAAIFFPPALLATMPIMAAGIGLQTVTVLGQAAGKTLGMSNEDWFLILASMVIAWIIVEYGGDVVRAVGGIVSFAKNIIFAGFG